MNYILPQITLATVGAVAEAFGQLNTIFSNGTTAQDQSEGNLAVVQRVFDGAANLSQNVSYTKNVSFFCMQ